MNIKCKKIATGIVVALCGAFSFAIDAATLTGDTSVSVLDAAGYSADSAVTLTYTSDADVAYAGVVSGPITFVKKGTGKLTLTAKWTHTGGTTVNAGTISVPDESYLGGNSALVTLDGGEVALTTGTGWSSHSILVPSGSSGAFNVASGVQVMLLFENKITLAGATLRLTGTGTVFAYGRPSNATYIQGGTIKVENGNLQTGSEFLSLKQTVPYDWTVEVCDGTTMYAEGLTRYLALPANTVFAGGVVRHNTFRERYGNDITQHATTFAGLTLTGRITVKPTAMPSRIDDYHVALAPVGSETVFDVLDGATLEIHSRLTPGLTANTYTSIRQDQGFVKTGKGELVIKGPVEAKGVVTVEEGTLTFSRRAYLGLQAKLDVWPGATVRLEDGTLVAAPSVAESQMDPLLATADIWMDATRIHVSDGVSVPTVRNMGRCGGTFQKFTVGEAGYIPGVPTYVNSGINGKPALNFDGSQALNLHSYTNTGNQLTTIIVYKPTVNTICSPFAMTDIIPESTSGDASLDGGITYSPQGNSIAYLRAETVTKRYDLNWISKFASQSAAETAPIILSHRRSSAGLHAGRAVYGANASDVIGASSAGYTANLAIRNVGLATRLFVNGAAMRTPSYNRQLNGRIGEFIVFSRYLSDAELLYIECYLRRKWFGSTDALPSNVTLPAAVTNLVLDVPSPATATYAVTGTAATVAATAKAVKAGGGTLAYASDDADFAQLDVADGALSIAPATASSLAAIWIDPSDSSTLTLEDDNGTPRVAAIRNKGSAGGAFTKVPYAYEETGFKALAPEYVASGINSHAVMAFDWHSGLSTEVYTNRSFETRNCYVYGIFKRTDYDDSVNDKGKASGPFCFTKRSTDAYDYTAGSGFYWREGYSNYMYVELLGSTSQTVGFSSSATTGDAYLFSLQQNGANYLMTQRMPENGAIKICLTDFRALTATDPLDVDYVMLGGRVYRKGAAYTSAAVGGVSRMWHGQIGEFLVFDRQLTQSDEAELVKYLEKKWFDVGSGSTTPPAFLTGCSSAPSFRSGTAVALADGTALKSSAGTVTFGSLSFSGDAILERTGGESMKFADVAGALSFGGSASLSSRLWPTNTVQLFTYGSLTAPSAWTLNAGRQIKHYDIEMGPGEVLLRYKPIGTAIYMR